MLTELAEIVEERIAETRLPPPVDQSEANPISKKKPR
jgi:hypothetical protein